MSDSEIRNKGGIPLRPLGKTGVMTSIIGMGGGNLCGRHINADSAVRLVQEAVDAGVGFMDNAWEYDDGESERRMGLGLEGRRDQVLLMTKVCARDRQGAEVQLEESLRRLRTDCIDIWQFHEINYDNDAEYIFAPGGAIEAAIKAQQQGKVRFIGFTGHKSPHILQRMLAEDFPWDTCQLPINVMDYHFRSFQREVLPELNRRDIAPLGMKSLGGQAQLLDGTGLTAEECRRFALTLPIATLICGMENRENLQQDVQIARDFTPMDEAERKEIVDRVRSVAGDGRHEWFKISRYYDSPIHQAQHGFPPIGTVWDEPD